MAVPEELAALCRREYPRLVGLLSLYSGDSVLAEELAQEALTVACRDWPKLKRIDHPSAWLHRVAINLANSHFRRRAAEKRAKDRLAARRTEESLDSDQASVMTLRRAIARLPKRQRTALVLHYYADLTFAQVAHAMDCPESTAKSLVRRAIASLTEKGGLKDLEEVRHVT